MLLEILHAWKKNLYFTLIKTVAQYRIPSWMSFSLRVNEGIALLSSCVQCFC